MFVLKLISWFEWCPSWNRTELRVTSLPRLEVEWRKEDVGRSGMPQGTVLDLVLFSSRGKTFLLGKFTFHFVWFNRSSKTTTVVSLFILGFGLSKAFSCRVSNRSAFFAVWVFTYSNVNEALCFYFTCFCIDSSVNDSSASLITDVIYRNILWTHLFLLNSLTNTVKLSDDACSCDKTYLQNNGIRNSACHALLHFKKQCDFILY